MHGFHAADLRAWGRLLGSCIDAVGPVGCRWAGIGDGGPHQCARLKGRKELWYHLPSLSQEMPRVELRWPLTRVSSLVRSCRRMCREFL